MNRGKTDCDDCERWLEPREGREGYRCKPHNHEIETILKCGTVTGSAPLCCNSAIGDAVNINENGLHYTVLATLALDTIKLVKPTIKIDFSSLISFKTCDDNYFLRLVFKLSKACDGSPIPLGNWTFKKIAHEDLEMTSNNCEFIQETNSFCFSWCECEDCPDCCRYIVEIVEQQCYNIEFVNVSNISLTAMVVGLKNPHY